MATTTNQGFLKHTQASGTAFAKVLRSLLNDLDDLLKGRVRETHTVADGGKVELNTRTADCVATIVNVDDHEAALVHIGGEGESVTILAQSGTSFSTTEDADTTTNVYYDSGNTRYELNNEKGGERTYEVVYEGL